MEVAEERDRRESGVWSDIEKPVWSRAYVSSVRGGPAYSHQSEPKGHVVLRKGAVKAEHKCLQEGHACVRHKLPLHGARNLPDDLS